jgi:hypothetical protein
MVKPGKDIARPEGAEGELDLSPFFEYLKSEKGHEVTSRVLAIFEDLKKAALARSSEHAKFERTLQAGIVLVVVVAASLLTYFAKFDASLGVLFGTLVGYLFGRRNA